MNFESSTPAHNFEITSEGITMLMYPEIHGQLLWQDIETIVAFKQDMFVYDTVVVSILVKEGTVYEVNEDMPDFADFMTGLANHLPLPDEGWYLQVAFPAFETKPTLVFDRAGRTAEEVFRIKSGVKGQ